MIHLDVYLDPIHWVTVCSDFPVKGDKMLAK